MLKKLLLIFSLLINVSLCPSGPGPDAAQFPLHERKASAENSQNSILIVGANNIYSLQDICKQRFLEYLRNKLLELNGQNLDQIAAELIAQLEQLPEEIQTEIIEKFIQNYLLKQQEKVEYVTHAAFTRDDQYLVTTQGSLLLWQKNPNGTFEKIQEVDPGCQHVTQAFSMSPDGNFVAQAHGHGFDLYKKNRGMFVKFQSMRFDNVVSKISFDPTGEIIVVEANDLHLLKKNLNGTAFDTFRGLITEKEKQNEDITFKKSIGKKAKDLPAKKKEMQACIEMAEFNMNDNSFRAFSNDGTYLITTKANGTITIWRRSSDGTFIKIDQIIKYPPPEYISFSSDGKFLILVFKDNYDFDRYDRSIRYNRYAKTIIILKKNGGNYTEEIQRIQYHLEVGDRRTRFSLSQNDFRDRMTCFSLSPDDHFFAIGTCNGKVQLFRKNSDGTYSFLHDYTSQNKIFHPYWHWQNEIKSLNFNHDSQFLAIGTSWGLEIISPLSINPYHKDIEAYIHKILGDNTFSKELAFIGLLSFFALRNCRTKEDFLALERSDVFDASDESVKLQIRSIISSRLCQFQPNLGAVAAAAS